MVQLHELNLETRPVAISRFAFIEGARVLRARCDVDLCNHVVVKLIVVIMTMRAGRHSVRPEDDLAGWCRKPTISPIFPTSVVVSWFRVTAVPPVPQELSPFCQHLLKDPTPRTKVHPTRSSLSLTSAVQIALLLAHCSIVH